MSEAYLGEVRIFAGNFAPRGWRLCDGSLLSIAQDTALFSLLGTTYGGNGQTTFGLPDLRGRVVVHNGQGPGLSSYTLGQISGSETVTLSPNNLPAHNHTPVASGTPGNASTPAANHALAAQGPAGNTQTNSYVAYNAGTQVALAPQSIGISGSDQPHTNIQPTLAINYIIAVEGIFPSRN